MAKIIVRVYTKTGDTEFEVDGVIGSACKEITDILAQTWDVYDEKDKPEFYEELESPETIENM